MATAIRSLSEWATRHAQPLGGRAQDYDALLDDIGDARFVLLGEATHGTHEFYRERAVLTRRLIAERGFHAVCVEADWPDAYRVNLHVRGQGRDHLAVESLGGFKRFPTWMWRNTDVLEFVSWLARHNEKHAVATGFYGMDLYSLFASITAVCKYLDKIDPFEAALARSRYACFDHYGDDCEAYGHKASLDLSASCEREVLNQLVALRERAAEWTKRDGIAMEDAVFSMEQNARLVRNAEEYYRSLLGGRVKTWNLRDSHMVQTLHELTMFLDRRVGRSKIVVWAHNSHLGDARATSMRGIGEHNVGQLVRERFPDDSYLIGFTTYDGTVSAASAWDRPVEKQRVRPALEGSYEAMFHGLAKERGMARFVVPLRGARAAHWHSQMQLERAIGVVYAPRTERVSHYFDADLAAQFDAVIHIDRTRAVEPLETTPTWTSGEPPETYPFAL